MPLAPRDRYLLSDTGTLLNYSSITYRCPGRVGCGATVTTTMYACPRDGCLSRADVWRCPHCVVYLWTQWETCSTRVPIPNTCDTRMCTGVNPLTRFDEEEEDGKEKEKGHERKIVERVPGFAKTLRRLSR
jgi:hypothetical protein